MSKVVNSSGSSDFDRKSKETDSSCQQTNDEESSGSVEIDQNTPDNSDDEDVAPIRITRQVPRPMATYGLSREKKKSFMNTSYTFNFHVHGNSKYWTKTSKRHPDGSIPIYTTGSEDVGYVLLVGNGCSSFSLRKDDESSTELVTVNIVTDASLLRLPRRSVVYIFPEMGGPAFELESKQPSKGARGHWILNFENKFVIPSVKNTVYCEKTGTTLGGNEVLMMRKIGTDAYELDASENIPELAVFAIGLSLCLSK